MNADNAVTHKFYREEPLKTRVREHGTGEVICECKLPSHAVRVVNALNAHAALVAACENALITLDGSGHLAVNELRAVLALAKAGA